MVFSSLSFILGFMPVVMLGFGLAVRIGPRAAALWLVPASLAFYACWRLSFLPLLLISIAFNFSVGWVIVPGLFNALN